MGMKFKKRGGDFKDTVYSFGEVEEEPYCLCRWLRARKFKFDDVIKMVEEATDCRADAKKEDFYPDSKIALGVDTQIYLAQYPQLYHSNGKNGCPIFISKPGKLNITAVECITTLPGILRYHWHVMMHDFKGKLQENKKNDKNFNNFACIMVLDLGELSVSQLNSTTLAIIQEQSFVDSLCFPETMSRTLIVNSPRFFSATWQIIKGWLDPRTVGKIDVISSRKAMIKKLLEVADAKDLPSDYGGTAPLSDLTILKQNSTGSMKRNLTEVMTIRSSTSTVVELLEGEKMELFIYCKAKSGATFSVTDANNPKKIFSENIEVTFKAEENKNEQAPAVVTLATDISGPGKFKVRGVSKTGRLSGSDNYLLVGNIYDK